MYVPLVAPEDLPPGSNPCRALAYRKTVCLRDRGAFDPEALPPVGFLSGTHKQSFGTPEQAGGCHITYEPDQREVRREQCDYSVLRPEI
jgi:hypothetical protein